jgi:hypothetical protein
LIVVACITWTGDKSIFKSLDSYDDGTVTFGSEQRKSKFVGLGTVDNQNITILSDILLIVSTITY